MNDKFKFFKSAGFDSDYKDYFFVLVDTSVLLKIFEVKKDLFELLKEKLLYNNIVFIILKEVFEELEGLSKGNSKRAFYAKSALKFLNTLKKQKTLKILDEHLNYSYNYTDDIILEFAFENNFLIFTQDLDLVKKAKKKGLKVFYLKKNMTIGD